MLTSAGVPLDRWFMGAVENEKGLDGEREEAKETVIQRSQGRVLAAWSSSISIVAL